MENDTHSEDEPKTTPPVEDEVVKDEVVSEPEPVAHESEVTPDEKSEPTPQEAQEQTPMEEPKPAPTLAEEMSAMTSAAPAATQAPLETLPFPWLRTFLIGLFIPLLTAAIAIGVYYLIEKTVGYNALANYKWALWAVLGIAAVPVVWGASALLHAMHVGRAFFLAAGTLICSFGTVALASTLYATSFHTAWNWHPVVLTWPQWMVMGLPFVGGAIIIFLTLIINSLGRYIPKLLTIILFLAIVAAPWVGNYFKS